MAPTLMLSAAMEMCHTVHYLLTFSHISNVGEHTYQPQPLLPSTFHPTQLQPCLHHTNLHCSERSSFLLVDHICIDTAVGVPYKFCICTLVGGEASYRHPYNVCPGHNAAGLQLRCAAHSDTSSCCYWQVGAVFYTCTPSPTHTHTHMTAHMLLCQPLLSGCGLLPEPPGATGGCSGTLGSRSHVCHQGAGAARASGSAAECIDDHGRSSIISSTAAVTPVAALRGRCQRNCSCSCARRRTRRRFAWAARTGARQKPACMRAGRRATA
jgi:hypothetical protein